MIARVCGFATISHQGSCWREHSHIRRRLGMLLPSTILRVVSAQIDCTVHSCVHMYVYVYVLDAVCLRVMNAMREGGVCV